MLANRRGESLNAEKSEVQGNMSVRIQTQTLLSRAWRSQNTEDFCSLRDRVVVGRRMMASKLNCRCQSLPCPCVPASLCVPGQGEEMLIVQEGEKGSRKTAPAEPPLSQGCGRCWEGPQHFHCPSSSSVPPQAQRRWERAKRLMVCADLQMNLHEFAYISLSVCIHSLRCL